MKARLEKEPRPQAKDDVRTDWAPDYPPRGFYSPEVIVPLMKGRSSHIEASWVDYGRKFRVIDTVPVNDERSAQIGEPIDQVARGCRAVRDF